MFFLFLSFYSFFPPVVLISKILCLSLKLYLFVFYYICPLVFNIFLLIVHYTNVHVYRYSQVTIILFISVNNYPNPVGWVSVSESARMKVILPYN